MVSWAWERPDGGRSLGYSGCHYHENWQRPEYRRFISQGVLWTLKISPPEKDIPAEVPDETFKLAP
jgi:type 1 glutamine amidotransferase